MLAVFGRVRGSLGLATVGTCEVFGAMSGSSQATVAAVGRLMYPVLLERGYGKHFSIGLVTSSGAIAIVIPPSITVILYGAAAEESVAKLFAGGILPGILMGVFLAAYIVWYARRNDIRDAGGSGTSRGEEKPTGALWSIGTPLIILGGIYLGVFSPTEAAGVAGVYAIVVARYVYKELMWSGIWDVAVTTMYITAQVLLIVAAAGVFSWTLTVSGIPQSIVASIAHLQAPGWGILLVINGLLLVVGCFIDPASAVIILTPLLAPIIKHIGVDPIHFGIIMTVNLAIGMYTPPFGLNIFTSQAIFDVPVGLLYRALVPFIINQIIALAMITYVPWLSLFLPSLL
jgi:C4-dicarboxylate transporter DctM subunit